MKRHGRSHVLEREPAAGGHIMRARLTRGDGFTPADRAAGFARAAASELKDDDVWHRLMLASRAAQSAVPRR